MEDLELEVSFYLHATEDEAKVLGALERELGLRAEELRRHVVKGHHGNPIVIFEGKLGGRRAEEVLGSLGAGLDEASRRYLIRRAEEIVDKSGKIHIRVDKQGVVLGRISLGGGDPVKLTVNSRNRRGLLDRVLSAMGCAEGEG